MTPCTLRSAWPNDQRICIVQMTCQNTKRPVEMIQKPETHMHEPQLLLGILSGLATCVSASSHLTEYLQHTWLRGLSLEAVCAGTGLAFRQIACARSFERAALHLCQRDAAAAPPAAPHQVKHLLRTAA